MAKTLNDATELCRTYLDESQPANWTVSEVRRAINNRYHYFVSKVIEVYEEFYLTVIPKYYSTVVNQQQYAIDPLFLKIERVEINIQPNDPNTIPQRAIALKIDELPLALSSNLYGSGLYNVGYYLIGNQGEQVIGFVPVPQQAATNNIAVWGLIAPADLVDDTDPIIIPFVDNFYQIIAKLAAADLLKKGQQAVQAADDLVNEGMVDVLNAQTFIKERQSDGPQMIEEAAFDDIMVADYYM